MYFQFLIEDQSTGILVNHLMKKVKAHYMESDVEWNIKPFGGIGHLRKTGNALQQKTGKLLNDLAIYMRGFSKVLQNMNNAVLVVVLDNDKRNTELFKNELAQVAISNFVLCDYEFCIAIKEMEAWLLGDCEAIQKAYPRAKIQFYKRYTQDAICETWEVLAEMVYPNGLSELRKKAGGSYWEIGKAKCEWADKIGQCMKLHGNASPSYCNFINALERRIYA